MDVDENLSDDMRLVTYYQPFYNLASRRLQGFEALARRRPDPSGEAQPPADFFRAVQAADRMREVDLHILGHALQQLAEWQKRGVGHSLIMSVNLSWDLVGALGFTADVTLALERHGVSGDRVLVDISTDTFRRLKEGDNHGLAALSRLREHEITFCLDGFTEGDLGLLPEIGRLPVDIIKLHPNQFDGQEQVDVRLRRLATEIQDTGLPVVAAGIETDEQLALVENLGFEWAQGFLLGEPVGGEEALNCPVELKR